LLYAGTEHGIYVSFDNGDHWQSLSLNLPDTQVSDIVVETHDVVIATHGRSFYILDDVDVLRQLTPEIAAAPIHLYQPREAIRSVNQAAFYYYLKEPADKVIDRNPRCEGKADSQLHREFARKRRRREDRRAAGRRIRLWSRAAAHASDNAGLTRFSWDLRYPGATVFPGMILWSANACVGPRGRAW
jgi:hypothetical protein